MIASKPHSAHIRRTLYGLADDHVLEFGDGPSEDITAGDVRGLLEQLEAARTALELVGAIQRTRLGWYRDQGVVFESKLNGDPDPDDWESIAFWTYTDLCEVESIARATLEESNPAMRPPENVSYYVEADEPDEQGRTVFRKTAPPASGEGTHAVGVVPDSAAHGGAVSNQDREPSS